MPPRKMTKPPAGLVKPPVNPAVAALGVGTQPDRWTLPAIISRLEQRYLALLHMASDETAIGRSNRARLFSAQAAEVADLIASYYQDNSREPDDYKRWSSRFKQAQSAAFRTKNQIAENLHAGIIEDA